MKFNCGGEYQIRLTTDEERLFLEGLRNNISSISWTILKKAYKRGDIRKIEKDSKG